MKKFILFFSMFFLAFCLSNVVNGQYADFGTGMEGPECAPFDLNLYNWSDTAGLDDPSWEWDIDGDLRYEWEPAYPTFGPGSYTIILTLYDGGLYYDSYQQSFQVLPQTNDFTMSTGAEACPGEEVGFWFDDEIFWYGVNWTFGDNSVPEPQHQGNYPVHTYYEDGIYDVTMILDHWCGTDSIVKQITVGPGATPNPRAYISNGPDFCPGDPVVFDVEGEFTNYSWEFGDGETSTERRPTHIYATDVSTSFTAIASVTNICDNTDTNAVIVTFRNDLEADAGFDYWFESNSDYPCPGTPVEFNAWGAGAFEWDFGDGSMSNEKKAVNYFTQPGKYYVKLNVWNGCGSTDTGLDSIEIMLDPSDVPFADFYFEIPIMDGYEDWSDTIVVCPGMLIDFTNSTYRYSEADISYQWDLGDGTNAYSKNTSHVYSTASPVPYQVSLTASNACGGVNTMTKYVLVDDGLMPDVDPAVTPLVVCSGEEVFFYFNQGLDQGLYTIDIDFGDGQSLNNATTYADSILNTMANHVYTGTPGQTFDYVYSITNICGNTLDLNGTVTITDNEQLKPFYYLSNSVSIEGGETQMEDWSVPHDPSDHEFVIHVEWPDWPGPHVDFAVFFWYEGFYPDGDMGPANGIVEFSSPDIQLGDSVRAYVPIDPNYSPNIGFAVGWTCDGTYAQGVEPEVWAMQMDFVGSPVNSFPIYPNGYTNMNTEGDPIVLNSDGSWDGLCNNEKPGRNYYYKLNAGQYIQLTFDKEYGEYYLYASTDQDGYDVISSLSSGDYYILEPGIIEFTDWGDCGFTMGLYNYVINGDQMDLIPDADACTQRAKYLGDSIFTKQLDFGMGHMGLSGCPGDDVLFKIAGGVSYEWHFGDASPVSTERYPVHVYSAPGIYDAFVVATNACGRIDTMYSPVEIGTTSVPMAYFWYDGYDHSRLESINFYYGNEWMDEAGNYSYSWEFGDGATSTLKNPVHAYERDGDFTVKLTVSNGCGSNTTTQMIYIKDAVLNCEAKIQIDSVVDKTIYLKDISRGDVTDWFWDFGDGFTSSLQNPSHTYNYDGIFFVCLSIYDEISGCAHQVCRQVQIGTQSCIADFTATVNNATNRVQFTDRSTDATEWFWDFGDGSFSDLKDPVHTYNESGWYYVCLSTYNDVTDCFDYRCKEFQVGEEDSSLCFASFTYFVDEDNNTVLFNDESSEGITNWYWTFGDGTYTEERNPVKTYPAAGIYPVCLFVFDRNTGCTEEFCMEIPVGVSDCNLRADFSFFIDIADDAVTFSNRSGGTPTNYFWDFGDGSTSSAKSPRHIYERPGFYLVILSIWDEENGCSDHTAKFLQIGTVDCRAAFEYKVDAATRNVQFYNQSKGTIAEYFWDFDDGTYSDAVAPMHQYAKPGIYFVSLTVISDNGLCMDFVFEPIQVGTVDCAAEFKYFIDSLNNVAYFTPEAIGSATDYVWFFGDGAISTNKEARHVFSQPGYYTVGLNTFNEATGCMDYWEEVILIGRAGEDCRANFSYVSDPDMTTIKFGDRSKGTIVEYIWDFGDGNYSFDQNPQHTYAMGGYYLVCLTVVNNFGILNTYCDFVQLATSDDERCFAEFFFSIDSVTRTVEFVQQSHGNPDEFLWDFGDGMTMAEENPMHQYDASGYYLVTLGIRNTTTNCKSKRTELINVSEGNNGLRADFIYGIDSSNLKADTYPVDFVGVSLGDAGRLRWTFGDGQTDTTTLNPTHNYQNPGEYTVCLTVWNPITMDKHEECETITVLATGIDTDEAWNNRIRNYPNPFKNTTNIVYDLVANTPVDLVLFDQTGRMIDILVREKQIAGHYQFEYNGSALDSGIYTLRLATNEGVYIARMLVQ